LIYSRSLLSCNTDRYLTTRRDSRLASMSADAAQAGTFELGVSMYQVCNGVKRSGSSNSTFTFLVSKIVEFISILFREVFLAI
jgi:hypothetical protein